MCPHDAMLPLPPRSPGAGISPPLGNCPRGWRCAPPPRIPPGTRTCASASTNSPRHEASIHPGCTGSTLGEINSPRVNGGGGVAHPVFTRCSSGVHAASIRRPSAVHPVCIRCSPGVHPVFIRCAHRLHEFPRHEARRRRRTDVFPGPIDSTLSELILPRLEPMHPAGIDASGIRGGGGARPRAGGNSWRRCAAAPPGGGSPRAGIPYRTVPYRTVPYRTVPYRTVPYRTVPCRMVRHGTARHGTAWHGTPRRGAARHEASIHPGCTGSTLGEIDSPRVNGGGGVAPREHRMNGVNLRNVASNQ
jgi:hypothetical protein